MSPELAGSLGLFKSMFDIAKGLKDLNDTTVRNQAIIELQEKILAAQQAQTELAEQVGDLEEEITRLKAWGAEKQNYELKEVRQGCFAYTLKEGVESTEPDHKLCANCYNQDKKSILQKEYWVPGRFEVLVCHRCDREIFITGSRQPEHSGGRSRR